MKSFRITNRVIIGICIALAYAAFTITFNYIKDPLTNYFLIDKPFPDIAFDTFPFLSSITTIYVMIGIKVADWLMTLILYPFIDSKKTYPVFCRIINILGIITVPFIAIYTALIPYWVELAINHKLASELPYSKCATPEWIVLLIIVITASILSIIADVSAILLPKSNKNSKLITGIKVKLKSLLLCVAIPVFAIILILYYPARIDKLIGGKDWTKDMLIKNCDEIRDAIELDNGGVDTTFYDIEYGEVLYDDVEESISFFGCHIKLTYYFVSSENNEVIGIKMKGKRIFNNRYSWVVDEEVSDYITEDKNGIVIPIT